MSVPKRLRAILVTSLLWAVAWLPGGLVRGLLEWRRLDRHPSPLFEGVPLEFIAWTALVWATLGAISGACFAIALMVAERRRALHTLSLRRVALWGGLGALSVPILMTGVAAMEMGRPPAEVIMTLCIIAGLGAASAAATLGLARRDVPLNVKALAKTDT